MGWGGLGGGARLETLHEEDRDRALSGREPGKGRLSSIREMKDKRENYGPQDFGIRHRRRRKRR